MCNPLDPMSFDSMEIPSVLSMFWQNATSVPITIPIKCVWQIDIVKRSVDSQHLRRYEPNYFHTNSRLYLTSAMLNMPR